ncbi:MAG: RNA polymerase subunit sigma-70 [Chloroflexi bacterium HGW-Chloroflexi-3]|nr:MAG: RNA polymerase subunit sigma-70 [Chloroflexi bacterium HGW-Chloroflexi-3]
MKIQSLEQPIEDQHEQKLVRQAIAGDAEAFAGLYELYVERIYRYTRSRLGDDQTAEDLTSQVFLNVWQHLDRYQQRGIPFRAWLFRIAHNSVIDHYRLQKDTASFEEIEAAYTPEAISMDEITHETLENQRIRQAIGHLTEEQQQVVRLKFIGGLNTQETARLMGKHPGAIRALQMRALQALGKILEL